MTNSEAIDRVIELTLKGDISVIGATRQLEDYKVRGGFEMHQGNALSYCGYDYANQRWISR